jgi:hypothetical protein
VDDGAYNPAEAGGPLRQGELLSTVEQYVVHLAEASSHSPVGVERVTHPFAVILTQDCDLAQDFNVRSATSNPDRRPLIPGVLMCEVDLARNLKGDPARIAPGSDIWKRIIQNKDERFQYLRGLEASRDALGTGAEPLLVDFKRSFIVETAMLYEQLKKATRRRAVLTSPYREQLSYRHACYIARVALPRDHHV